MRYEEMCAHFSALLTKSATVLMLTTVLCGMSCKSTKTTAKVSVEQHSEVKTEKVRHASSSEDTFAASSTDVDQTVTETLWSVPDSTGKQFPIATRTTESKVRSNANRQTKAAAQAVTSTSAEEQTTAQTDVQITEKKTGSKFWWGLLIIFLIIAAAVTAVRQMVKHF